MEGEYILLPFPTYNTPRGLRQDPGCTAESLVEGQDLRKWESRNACAVVDVRGTRGRRAAGGTGGGVAGTRRGGAGVRATGLRGAVGRGRRAAGADRPAGARADARGDAGVGGGRAPARRRADRRTLRQAARGGRRI